MILHWLRGLCPRWTRKDDPTWPGPMSTRSSKSFGHSFQTELGGHCALISKSTISIPQTAFSKVYVDSLESVRYYSGTITTGARHTGKVVLFSSQAYSHHEAFMTESPKGIEQTDVLADQRAGSGIVVLSTAMQLLHMNR